MIELRTILLKSVPYLLSIAGGVTLFLVSVDNIKDPSLNDLINNIAASLLSIPLVFLLYDYSNYRISRQVNKTLTAGMADKVNSLMLNIVILMREMMGASNKMTWAEFEKTLNRRVATILPRLKITSAQIDRLHTYHNELDELVYRAGRGNILSSDQIQTLSLLARNISHLINEHKFRAGKKVYARYVEHILDMIGDWLDSDAAGALRVQQNLEITDNGNGDAIGGA